MDELTPTSDTSTALSPAGDAAVSTDTSTAATSGSDTGVDQLAQTALDQAQTGTAPDPLAQVLSAIPADDADLATYQGQPIHQTLTSQRQQLRVLGDAVRTLQPLRSFEQFGDPAVVANRLKIAELLYSPAIDPRTRKPIIDPNTRATRLDPRPFVEHIDKVSPGLPEQLLVALLALETENEFDQPEPLVSQMFRFYKLNFGRLAEYQNIDALAVKATGTVTPEELAEIPSEYHAAYRAIPPSIRAAWKSLDEVDQTRLLEDYKGKLESAQREARLAEVEKNRQAQEQAAHAQHVADETEKYLDTVRRERTGSLIKSLSQQITYSTDAVANQIKIGSLAATMAQLLDRNWRFVVEENVLTPLGLKLDHTFDAALDAFEGKSADSVANRLAGDVGRAEDDRLASVGAANQLMAKIAIIALAVAKKEGAVVVEKAALQAAQLGAATAARPTIGQDQPGNGNGFRLPAGMMPGSREAAEYTARQVNLFVEGP
jgi:hypothetical protein